MKRSVYAFVLLLSCTAAFANDLVLTREDRQPPNRKPLETGEKERAVAPMLYALPALGNTEEVVLELRISNARRTLVRQTVAVPAALPKAAVIDVLVTHPKELQRLRTMDKESSGALRFIASIGDRILTDAPFAEIDKAGAALSTRAAVGAIREVEVKLIDPQRVRTLGEPDPGCVAECDLVYQDCYARCDERGDSCARCSDDYNDCVYYCPDVCTEPKSVENYTVWTPTNWAWYGNQECFGYWSWSPGTVWHEVYVWYTVRTYQRTEHCDGSYTDTQIGQYNTSGWCWAETSQSCSNPSGGPYNVCP